MIQKHRRPIITNAELCTFPDTLKIFLKLGLRCCREYVRGASTGLELVNVATGRVLGATDRHGRQDVSAQL